MGLWAPVLLQGPREMAHRGPAEPAVHAHAAVVVLHTPPAMHSLSLTQPWLPHSCTVGGAGPRPLMQNCKHTQAFMPCTVSVAACLARTTYSLPADMRRQAGRISL